MDFKENDKSFFKKITLELELVLEPLVADARAYYKKNDAGYFVWLCKAAKLKQASSSVRFEDVTPEKLELSPEELLKLKSRKK